MKPLLQGNVCDAQAQRPPNSRLQGKPLSQTSSYFSQRGKSQAYQCQPIKSQEFEILNFRYPMNIFSVNMSLFYLFIFRSYFMSYSYVLIYIYTKLF